MRAVFVNEGRDLSDTKIVDEQGKPLVVFRSQKDERDQKINRLDNLKGIYFSADEESTKIYGKLTKKYHLNIKNPLVLKDKEWNLSLMEPWVYKNLINKGYDRAVWLRKGVMYEIIAFYEDQAVPIEQQ
jgi:hypothetical protein